MTTKELELQVLSYMWRDKAYSIDTRSFKNILEHLEKVGLVKKVSPSKYCLTMLSLKHFRSKLSK